MLRFGRLKYITSILIGLKKVIIMSMIIFYKINKIIKEKNNDKNEVKWRTGARSH